MSKKQKTWISVGVSAVVIIALVLVIAKNRSQKSSSTATYQTTTVQLGTLTSSVEGTGTLESIRSDNLAWEANGHVGKVLVQVGSQVKSGDVLATLVQSGDVLATGVQSSQSQRALESDLVTARENLAELTSPEAIANAKLAVTTAQTDVINAQSGLNNTQYWKNDALIQDYYAAYIIAKANLDKAQDTYDSANVGEYINNSDEAELYQTLYTAKNAYDIAEYNFSLYSQTPTQRQLDEAQATLDLANATLTNAKNYLAALTGGDVPADATGASLLKLKEAELAVQTAQDNLDVTKLTAPFDGTITQANAIPGATVSTGTQIFRIDDLSNLVIAVQVTEIDINGVQDGQPATITFDAIPNKTYNGTITQTDLAGTVGTNSVNFTVNVKITDADALVKPGMAANVTIITNQVDNALLVPSTSIFTDSASGQQYVYLIQDGTPTMVVVTVGATSDTTSQILDGGLKEGDTIILSFASTSDLSNLGFGMGGGTSSQPAGTP
jgi:HlyD family secretion protein